jgi:hypothetical protein
MLPRWRSNGTWARCWTSIRPRCATGAEREEIDSAVRPGHSSYAITADIYSHVGPAQQREAADRLDEALRW